MDQQFWWRLHRVALVVLVCHDLIQQRRISGWDGGLTGQRGGRRSKFMILSESYLMLTSDGNELTVVDSEVVILHLLGWQIVGQGYTQSEELTHMSNVLDSPSLSDSKDSTHCHRSSRDGNELTVVDSEVVILHVLGWQIVGTQWWKKPSTSVVVNRESDPDEFKTSAG
ncbi:hypothetical protein PAXINDRAFT_153161 [Paxillus involutus ATCC 200175]|nr:hypothetical protein PAXINDRAFT_153161 [Paxillus involutus ATCC 200175]